MCKSYYHTITTTTALSGTGSNVYIKMYCILYVDIAVITYYHYILLDLLRIDQQLDHKIHIYLSLHICHHLNKSYLGMYSHQLVGLDNSGRPLVYHTCLYMTLMFCRRSHHHMPRLKRTKKNPKLFQNYPPFITAFDLILTLYFFRISYEVKKSYKYFPILCIILKSDF